MTFKETEQKIKKYYESLNIIEALKHKLAVLEARKKELTDKIKSSSIYLDNDLSAINYSGTGAGGGIKASFQEKAIDKAFAVLEKNLKNVENEILLIQEQINSIETENADMEFILKGRRPEYEKIMKDIYKDKKGMLRVAMELNMDRATVYRKKDKVIKEVMRWINFYN